MRRRGVFWQAEGQYERFQDNTRFQQRPEVLERGVDGLLKEPALPALSPSPTYWSHSGPLQAVLPGQRSVMKELLIPLLLLLLVAVKLRSYRHDLPYVPDALNPPIPDEVSIPKLTESILDQIENGEEVDPEVSPGLFQGDMAMTNEIYNYWRVGLKWDVFPKKKWENGTVPYVISPLYEPAEFITISRAISTINFMTCVKFVPWDGKKQDYLLIWPIKFPKGCWSYVGKHGGPQIVSLQPPDAKGPNCLGNEGRAMHELMHALGIFHEQSRHDRDKFVTIHKDNIIPQYLSNFDKQSKKNTTFKFEYDYDSIMHYGRNFFSKGKGKPTITPKHPGAKLGQRKMLSKTDCLKINDLYGCLEKSSYLQKKYYTICQVLGL